LLNYNVKVYASLTTEKRLRPKKKSTTILAIISAGLVVVAFAGVSFVGEASALVVQRGGQETRQSNDQAGAINVGANVGAQVGNTCVICG
jgi:hypothetical protein